MVLETLNSKKPLDLLHIDTFDTGQLELWFQPVYQLKTGAVLHNEVLLRWRDEHGNLHLPEEFLSSFSSAGALQQLDRTVIGKATELLAQQPDRCISINLSGEGLNDFSLIEYIQTALDQSGVDPKQLSFELTEAAIAKDFSTTRAFTRELKNLGCLIVLDNFASRDLTLFQCQQLDVDLVKVDGQLIQRLKTDPSSRVLTRAILDGVQTLSQVCAKFVTDAVTEDLVREVGLNYVQGYHFQPPSAEPDWTDLVKSAEPVVVPVHEGEQPPLSWRVLKGMGFVLLGLAAVAVGLSSIGYRMIHFTVDNGVINGRISRLQAIADGRIEAFYARPGLEVKSGQVLARLGLERQPEDGKTVLELERAKYSQQESQIRTQLEHADLLGQIQVKNTQLVAARESLALLRNQLQALDSQDKAIRQVSLQLASEAVSQEQAVVAGAVAKAKAARLEYERYQQLVAAGAVSRLKTDQLRSAWESAEAEVQHGQAALRATQASLNASRNGVALNNQNDLSDQRTKLLQAIQEQETLVDTLQTQVASAKQQLNQSQSLYAQRPALPTESKVPKSDRQVLNVSAPFAGVIYRTEHEQGEQVSKTDPLLTLLDCNELWVETVVSIDDANRIDPQKPVKVHLANASQPLTGEVDLIQPIDRTQGITEQTKLRQVQALLPTIPPQLEGQLLALVTVKIPPTPQYSSSQQFCGLGQATRVTFAKKMWRRR